MGILSPDYDMIAKVEAIVDEVNVWYSNELKLNNDIDDIQSLGDMLNVRCKKLNLPIEWEVHDDEREHPEEWISAMAGFTASGSHLWVMLWERNLNGTWGPKTFKERVLGMLGHETIHFAQYKTIGRATLLDIESGHQKGLRLATTGDSQTYMREYLSDPHELMAYGHDLAYDIKLFGNPDALRSPSKYIEELPVYRQYRRFFERDSKQIKRLLSYAARYYEDN